MSSPASNGDIVLLSLSTASHILLRVMKLRVPSLVSRLIKSAFSIQFPPFYACPIGSYLIEYGRKDGFNMKLDKSSLEYLKYIYRHKECTFRELCQWSGIEGIEETSLCVAIILQFVNDGLIAIIHTDRSLVSSYNLPDAYESGQAVVTPDSWLIILPKGAYYVEQFKYKSNALWIPIVISLFSLLVSFIK